MSRLLHKTPPWIQRLYPNFIWKVPTEKREIYLTFDDGPIPEVTEWVLDQLSSFNAKATFFVVGENLIKNKSIAQEVIKAGHVIGNHTHNHLKGWENRNFTYWRNILRCERELCQLQPSEQLFRPPYGRITRVQASQLRNFKIIMWNRLAWDFGQNLKIDSAVRHLNDDAPLGSIFVFHDNIRSFENLRELLPQVLQHYSDKGYSFSSLTSEVLD